MGHPVGCEYHRNCKVIQLSLPIQYLIFLITFIDLTYVPQINFQFVDPDPFLPQKQNLSSSSWDENIQSLIFCILLLTLQLSPGGPGIIWTEDSSTFLHASVSSSPTLNQNKSFELKTILEFQNYEFHFFFKPWQSL